MERAIVTEVPGTTRDVLSESAEIEGVPVRLLDTAGVRETEDTVERIGVSRTWETLAEVDLVLCVFDASSPLLEEDHKLRERIAGLPHLLVANKVDVVSSRDAEIDRLKPIWISARTGDGLDTLREAIGGMLGTNRAEAFANALLTTSRQYEAVGRADKALKDGASALRTGTPHEMVLLDLYEGLSSLNELTGEITSEDILGRIFSTFCIGK
jgi:tRNA modification GTPase